MGQQRYRAISGVCHLADKSSCSYLFARSRFKNILELMKYTPIELTNPVKKSVLIFPNRKE
jgi:hypothetical protein